MPLRYQDMGMGMGWGLFGLLFALAVIAIVVWAVVTLTLQWGAHRHPAVVGPAAAPDPSAQRILDERFARGEIDAEEFTRRRELLGRVS